MIYLILGLLILYIAWQIKQTNWGKTDDMGKLMPHFLVCVGGIFVLYWAYIYLVLPWEIGSFYNGGNGLSYMVNATSNFTVFNSTDESILLYNSNVRQDWVLLTYLMGFIEWTGGFLIFCGLFWWVYVHNVMGQLIRGGGNARPRGGNNGAA